MTLQELRESIRQHGCTNYHSFRKDIIEACGIAGHPKAEEVFELAKELNDCYHINLFDLMERLSSLVK